MTTVPSTTQLRSSAFVLAGRVVRWLDQIPYTLLAIPLRLAVATVFWDSAMAHLANWQTTLELFETEYALPLLPPHPSAYLAVTIELSTPPLLVPGVGLHIVLFEACSAFTRVAACTLAQSPIRDPLSEGFRHSAEQSPK